MIRFFTTMPIGKVRSSLGSGGGGVRIEGHTPDDVEQVEVESIRPGPKARRTGADGDASDCAVQDQEHAGRDQDPERAASGDGAVESWMSYFARIIAGSASRPIRVTEAPTIPVAVAKTVQVANVASRIEPRIGPSAIWMLRNLAGQGAGPLDDVPHEDEQRDGDQDVVGHDGEARWTSNGKTRSPKPGSRRRRRAPSG